YGARRSFMVSSTRAFWSFDSSPTAKPAQPSFLILMVLGSSAGDFSSSAFSCCLPSRAANSLLASCACFQNTLPGRSGRSVSVAPGFTSRHVEASTVSLAQTAAAAAAPAVFMKVRRDTPPPLSGQVLFCSIRLSPLSFLMYCNTPTVQGNVSGMMTTLLAAVLL